MGIRNWRICLFRTSNEEGKRPEALWGFVESKLSPQSELECGYELASAGSKTVSRRWSRPRPNPRALISNSKHPTTKALVLAGTLVWKAQTILRRS
eukprot:1949451-Amphidinium_carterae.1